MKFNKIKTFLIALYFINQCDYIFLWKQKLYFILYR